jgi:hypothetical protein
MVCIHNTHFTDRFSAENESLNHSVVELRVGEFDLRGILGGESLPNKYLLF